MAFQPSDGHASKRIYTHLILSLPHALPTFLYTTMENGHTVILLLDSSKHYRNSY